MGYVCYIALLFTAYILMTIFHELASYRWFKYPKKMVCWIGDGGNVVSMVQTADMGVVFPAGRWIQCTRQELTSSEQSHFKYQAQLRFRSGVFTMYNI